MAKLDFWMTLRKQAILLDLPHICTRHTPISTLQKTHPKNEYVYIYIYILDLDPVLNQTFQGVFARLIWQQDGEQHFSNAGEIGDVFRCG